MISFQDARAAQIFEGVNHKAVEAFKKYHADNPHVYKLFKKFAHQAKRKRNHYSHVMIFQRIRWFTDIETDGDDFKINNNFIPLYGRMLTYHEPEFEGFFEFRKLDAKKNWRPHV